MRWCERSVSKMDIPQLGRHASIDVFCASFHVALSEAAVACTTSTRYGASLTTGQLIVFSMHLAATVAGIYICVHICVFLAAFLGLISLYICLLPTCILLAYLVWWWLWGMSLVVSAVRWPCSLFIQFWAGMGHIMAYEYARGRQQEVQVCLVSVAWASMHGYRRLQWCPSLSSGLAHAHASMAHACSL